MSVDPVGHNKNSREIASHPLLLLCYKCLLKSCKHNRTLPSIVELFRVHLKYFFSPILPFIRVFLWAESSVQLSCSIQLGMLSQCSLVLIVIQYELKLSKLIFSDEFDLKSWKRFFSAFSILHNWALLTWTSAFKMNALRKKPFHNNSMRQTFYEKFFVIRSHQP